MTGPGRAGDKRIFNLLIYILSSCCSQRGFQEAERDSWKGPQSLFNLALPKVKLSASHPWRAAAIWAPLAHLGSRELSPWPGACAPLCTKLSLPVNSAHVDSVLPQ